MKKALSLIIVLALVLTLCPAVFADNSDKELVAGIEAAPSILDMHQTSALVDYHGLDQVYDTLVTKDSTGAIVGSLAESWEASEDGLIYTFKLHEGVKFSNGDELKASDVAWSINRAVESPFSSYNFPAIESANAVDDYTVEIHLSTPSVSFLETLTGSTAAIGCEAVYNQYGDDFGRTVESVVGTGAYILTDWTPGVSCTFVANEDYFKGAPSVKNLRIKTISDSSSAVIALQTGDIGYYFSSVPEISVPTIQSDKNLSLVSYNSTKLSYLSINTEDELFSDVKVRQALAYGIDRENLLAMGLDDAGTLLTTMAGPDYTDIPDVQWYEYNLAKAQELLAEAGATGANVVIKTYSTGNNPKVATALQAELSNIGLNAEVQLLEVNAMISDLETGNFQICCTGWTTSTKDTGDFYSLVFDSSNLGVSNDARYVNEDVDELLKQAIGEQDSASRTDLHKQIAETAKEDVPYIPFFVASENRAFSSDLTIDEGNVQYQRIYDFSWNG